MNHTVMIAVLLAASGTALGDRTPRGLGPEYVAQGRDAGHIYVNLATGERVLTHDRPTPRPRGLGGPEPVWMADNDVPCAAFGLNHRLVAALDRPDLDPSDPSYAVRTDMWAGDWGDIASDTVVDAVGLSYATQHHDIDADGDGFADGVEGFGASWLWLDVDNGWNFCGSYRYPVVSITLHDLPGDLDASDGQYATYLLTIDMKGGFGEDNSFELGDTDFDPQGAAHFNPGLYEDYDGDGLHDFSLNFRYHQPGTMDFDGDGVPDGDPSNQARAGAVFVAPSGPIVPRPNSDGVSTVDPVDAPPAAQGLEDAFDIWTADFLYYGAFWYRGFSCDRDGSGVPGDQPDDYRPFASFYQQLYSPGTGAPCPADLYPPPAGDGQLNFFDLSYFIARFGENDPLADIFPSGGDGVFNFFDVVAYINAFNAGCP